MEYECIKDLKTFNGTQFTAGKVYEVQRGSSRRAVMLLDDRGVRTRFVVSENILEDYFKLNRKVNRIRKVRPGGESYVLNVVPSLTKEQIAEIKKDEEKLMTEVLNRTISQDPVGATAAFFGNTDAEKPIDRVTVERLRSVLSFIGLGEITDIALDVIINVVELIEEKGGGLTLDDLEELRSNYYKSFEDNF